MRRFLVVAAATVSLFFSAFTVGYATHTSAPPNRAVETIYVQNRAPQYISDAEIRNDIPAWDAAMNQDFSPAWNTTQVRFVLTRKPPAGSVTATFVNKGPVKGALAYHTVTAGVPAIIVYAGTDDYYGYSNSVSFTHEAEELLADPVVSITNQGWPYDFIWLGDTKRLQQTEGTVWANEVSDPVEAYSYTRPGADGKPVDISDFITPNWFNDEVSGGYDHMGLVQQPFTILKGGYAQYWDPFLGWQAVENFRGAGRDAAGFLKGEKLSRR